MLTLLLAFSPSAVASCAGLTIVDTLSCSSVVTSRVTSGTPSQLGTSPNYTCGSPYAPLSQPGGEHVYSFTCQRTGTVQLDITGMDCDLDIYVLGNTCNPSTDCDAGSTAASTANDSVTFACTAGVDYYVVIEAYSCSSSTGRYTLSFDVSAGTGCPEDCADGVDNDFDGDVDCDDSDCAGETYCHCDDDLDGYDGTACGGTDCDDTNTSIHPGATEVCDFVDQDCDGVVDDNAIDAVLWYADADGDNFGNAGSTSLSCRPPTGYVPNDDDCDDGSATVYPGASEVAYDGIDQDCDGVDLVDLDGDGTTASWAGGTDCNDTVSIIHPGAPETANGIDDDCDGTVDEGTAWYDDDGDGWSEDGGDCDDSDASANAGAVETIDRRDEDCDGVTDEGTDAYDDDGDGLSEIDGDCNDSDSVVSPSRPEVNGNGIDDDCNGTVDNGIPDPDHDGYTADGGDCDSNDPASYPGAPELADGEDNDCDGVADEGTSAFDNDGDGTSADDGDCDDTDPRVHVGAPDPQNGRDDDCDGTVDEGTSSSDDDGDGVSELGGDCDDSTPEIVPGAEEVSDGTDNDCDGEVDEGLDDADGDGYSTAEGDCDDQDGWVQPEISEFCDGVDNNCNDEVDEDCEAEEDSLDGLPECGCGGASEKALLIGIFALPLVRNRRRRG